MIGPSSIIAMASLFGFDLDKEIDFEIEKNKIIGEYRNTKNLPRKQKKAKRKTLNKRYNTLIWSNNYYDKLYEKYIQFN